MSILSVSTQKAAQLSALDIQSLTLMIDGGLIRPALENLRTPASICEIYLYLNSQTSHELKQQFFIELIMNPETIKQHQNESVDQLHLLPQEIVRTILLKRPSIFSRFLYEKHQEGYITIDRKNLYGGGNMVLICVEWLKHTKEVDKIMKVVEDWLIPLYLLEAHADFMQLSSPILIACGQIQEKYSSLQAKLCELFIRLYFKVWEGVHVSSNDLKQVNQLQSHFALMQMLFQNKSYSPKLLNSQLLKSHLRALLRFTGQSRGNVHQLAISIYEKLAENKGQLKGAALPFIKVFNVLGYYGSHLIRDVWPAIYTLMESEESNVFSIIQLMDIIFVKLEHHENSNVIKNCLNELLQNPQSHTLFDKTPALIYDSLIRMLGLGVHYLDCMFHMDSKLYPLIYRFFSNYYNRPQNSKEALQKHLRWLLTSIEAKTNYDHAFIALLLTFKQQKIKTSFIGEVELKQINKLISGGFGRFPLRKKHQMIDSLLKSLEMNLNTETVSLNILLNFFLCIPQQYIQQQKIPLLQAVIAQYSSEQMKVWATEYAVNLQQEIVETLRQQEEWNLEAVLNKIQVIALYEQLINSPLKEYHAWFQDLLHEYADSHYKSTKQRLFVLHVYCRINQAKSSQNFSAHLSSVFSNVALLFYNNLDIEKAKLPLDLSNIVGKLFHEGYCMDEDSGARQELAKMLQWSCDHLGKLPFALQVMIQALRARITVLLDKKPDLKYQKLFEQTLFVLLEEILQGSHRIKILGKDKLLRLEVLLSTILTQQKSHPLYKQPPTCETLGDYIDRYDFQSYEQICWLMEAIYCGQLPESRLNEQEVNQLSKLFKLLLQNMIHNLQYSLVKKQIVPICNAVVNSLFCLAEKSDIFYFSLVQMVVQLLEAGDTYLIFQRQIGLLLTRHLSVNFKRLGQQNSQNLVSLILKFLTVEEYRGYDSAVYLHQESETLPEYVNFSPSHELNYLGAVPRFLLLFAFKNKILPNASEGPVLLKGLVEATIQSCMSQVLREKMFLSGKNKFKLQGWQFLLMFSPQIIRDLYGKMGTRTLISRCVKQLSHNSITQIRYYSELFLMRLLLHKDNYECIDNEVLKLIRQGLTEAAGNVSRSVSHMVVSGLLLRHLSNLSIDNLAHFESIQHEYTALFNALMAYVCSSVAYFRGLSQYFCLDEVPKCLVTPYVNILRENYLMDMDAVNLKAQLTKIMQNYLFDIKNWQAQVDLLRQLPTNCGNVVSNRYYMDILKKLGNEMASASRNQDGFTAYRYIWKNNVSPNEEESDNEQVEEKDEEQKEEEEVFQRKIDPALDYCGDKESGSRLKVLITSNKSLALLGHLARTGQIFGVEELIIPCRKSIELDQFKSISVTAERWLKISDLGATLGHNANPQSVLSALLRHRSQGYQVVKLSKKGQVVKRNANLPKKCLLMLDQQEILDGQGYRLVNRQIRVGQFWSLHVEASILVWQYFKSHLNQ